MLQASKEQPKQAFDMLSLIGPSTKTVESQNTNLTIDKVPMRTETDNERIFNDFSPKPAHDSIGSSHSAFTALKPDRGPFGRLGPVSSSARITEEFPFKRLHLDPCSVNRVFPVTSVFAGIMQRRKRRENRIRRQRTTFTSEQTLKLEVEYNRSEYISRPRRYELAEILNLSESQIKIWFQNRRAKEKRIEKAHVDHQIRSCDTASASMSPGGFPVPSSYTMFYGSCLWPYPPPTAVSELYTDASKGS